MELRDTPTHRLAYVIDDDREVRSSLILLLRSHGIVARPFGRAEDFLDELQALEPACLLVDIRMPTMSGVDLMRELKARDCYWPVAIITGHGDIGLAIETIKLGAIEFLQKPFSEQELLETVEASLAQLDARVARSRRAKAARKVLSVLSPREMQVFEGVTSGKTTKEIAKDFGLSPRTVESYRVQMMAKLGAERAQDLWEMASALKETA